MPILLAHAQFLKQELLDFTFDAEDEVAIALEKYSAEQFSQLADSPYQGNRRTELVIDSFSTDGSAGSRSVLDHFLESRSDLSTEDRAIVTRWSQGFIGLFAVSERLSDSMVLMNWLTEKKYNILLPNKVLERNISRLKTGEIVLSRILPIGNDWMLSGPATFLGKLGKPKLAVAIGNFKKYHKNYLYGDAPELLEEAWQSVEHYHQEFTDYFGSNEITLPGHQLEKKLADFQTHMTQQKLSDSGLDGEKSLGELANEAGISKEEIAETASVMGVNEKITTHLIENQKVSKMMMPTIELPKHLKSADHVSVLTHPRWGQVMVSTYHPLTAVLESFDQNLHPEAESLVNQCLKNLAIKPFVWHQLAQKHPMPLEKYLQTILKRPKLYLEQDLDQVLKDLGHPEQPELPETASVPVHLHNLFQDALLEVSRPKSSKSKVGTQSQKKAGFG